MRVVLKSAAAVFIVNVNMYVCVYMCM